MLREIPGPDKNIADRANTRALQNAAVRHHKNNPQSSMEAAFEYVMVNSATFRALPTACIDKARKYLALPPKSSDKDKQMSDKDTYTKLNEALQGLSDNNLPLFLMPFRRVITVKERTPTQLKETTTTEQYNEIPRLDKSRLGYFVSLVTASFMSGEYGTLGETFGNVRRDYPEFKIMNPDDIHTTWVKVKSVVMGRIGLPTYPGRESMVKPKPIKPNTTVVHAERVVVGNKKMIKILKFENVQKLCELPNKYCAHFPYFYALSDRSYIGICINLTQSFRVKVGGVITIKEFGQMIKTMKEAGVRLSKINKTAKLEKEHSGKFTVSI